MILKLVCCLFIFIGIFISEKKDFKKLSINALFGMFFLNCLVVIIPFAYSILFKNYHSTTLFYVLLSGILGFLLIKLVNCKYEDCDNISILGFSFVNMSLLISHRFSILLLLVNILYLYIVSYY